MSKNIDATHLEVADWAAKLAYSHFWTEIEGTLDCSLSETCTKIRDDFESAFRREGDRYRQRLCFINKLPMELLTRVLGDVMDLHQPEHWSFKRLNDLSRVQTSWKRITDMSWFWPTLLPEASSELLARTIYHRNRNGPLTVVIDLGFRKASKVETFERNLRIAATQRRRWGAFHWSAGVDNWPDAAKQLVGPTPQLQDLHLDAWLKDTLVPLVLIELSDGCHFRNVVASGFQLPWHSTRFRGLQSLRIEEGWSHFLPTLAEIELMLDSSPLLQELFLKSDDHLGGEVDEATLLDQADSPIHLPKLIAIELVLGTKAETYLLRRIWADNCQKLHARTSGLERLGDPSCALSTTITPILRDARSLHIFYWSLPHPHLNLITYDCAEGPSVSSEEREYGMDLILEADLTLTQDSESIWLGLARFITFTSTKLTAFELGLSYRDHKNISINLSEPPDSGNTEYNTDILTSDIKSFLRALPDVDLKPNAKRLMNNDLIDQLGGFLSQAGKTWNRAG